MKVNEGAGECQYNVYDHLELHVANEELSTGKQPELDLSSLLWRVWNCFRPEDPQTDPEV